MKKRRALSTICISSGLALLVSVLPAYAEDPPLGCFTRAYSAEHLAENPNQVVERIWLHFRPAEYEDDPVFEIAVLLADQGHAAEDGYGGMLMEEEGLCYENGTCAVYCDGGTFEVTEVDGDMIEITTQHLRVVSGVLCDEDEDDTHVALIASSLAESIGEPTTYRLFRDDDTACEGN